MSNTLPTRTEWESAGFQVPSELCTEEDLKSPPWRINGKTYHLWPQFVVNKAMWIGGTLEDHASELARPAVTKIRDIMFEPNGEESAAFIVVGEQFTCAGDVGSLTVDPRGERGWITFSGFMGHRWRIRQPDHIISRAV